MNEYYMWALGQSLLFEPQERAKYPSCNMRDPLAREAYSNLNSGMIDDLGPLGRFIS